jgi:hypothetical protein
MGVVQKIVYPRYSYHGQYQEFPYHTIFYQFTIVKRYCTG